MTLEQLIEKAERECIGTRSKPAMYEIYLHLNFLKRIIDSGDCNDCKSRNDCPIVPKPGEQVRYNCAFYKEKKNEDT